MSLSRRERRNQQMEIQKIERKISNVEKDKIKMLIDVYVSKEIDNIRLEAIKLTVKQLSDAFIKSINEEFGFGKERITKLLLKVDCIYSDIISGKISPEEIDGWCKSKGIEYSNIFNIK